MAGGKNVCEAVVHTVNLSAYKSAQRTVPLSKCLCVAQCKNTRMPSCIPKTPPCPPKNPPHLPACPPCEPLRLCNPLAARKLCQPDPCLCRPMRPPMTSSQKFAYTMGFALKCGAVVGLIWLSNEQGLWSGQHEVQYYFGNSFKTSAADNTVLYTVKFTGRMTHLLLFHFGWCY